MAYKNIREVMAAQSDLVTVLRRIQSEARENGAGASAGGLRKDAQVRRAV